MPLNLIKRYSDLLDLVGLSPENRTVSLTGVFKKDIQETTDFNFRKKSIRPTKKDGVSSMEVLFGHLTTREEKDEKNKKLGSRVFELNRSQRLHWIRHHTDEKKVEENNTVEVFSYEDRIKNRDVIRTYIYNVAKEYVIILEPQRSELDYYLLTAYHLNEPGGKRQIEQKLKRKLDKVY
ncbi:MAG TPA: hypothetical protein PLL00_05695 [Bacteroidia bacterium]|nr:hypothetical protein [Bacteroidia bacterium]